MKYLTFTKTRRLQYRLITVIGFIISLTDTNAQFREVSSEVGIEVFHQDDLLMGGGATFFDYNNDGWQDLFITGGAQSNKLFKNLGNKRFVDVSHEAGLVIDFVVINSTGVIAGDINNDGFDDLFISTEERFANQLYLNNGDGTFTDIAIEAGLLDRVNSSSAAFIDVNEDGFLDIYLTNYVENLLFIIDDNDVITGFGHDCIPNYLYINNGDLTFDERSREFGVRDLGCGLAVVASDLNRDGHTDLYVANDFGFWLAPSRAYLNLNPGLEFTRLEQSQGLEALTYARGIAVGDVDNNGLPDYYATNIGPNQFFVQEDPNSFTEQAQAYGIANDSIGEQQITSWGTFFFDFDHDLDLDLFVSNGFLTNLALLNSTINDPDKLFVNNGNGSFEPLASFDAVASRQSNRGAVYADYDRDGDLDIYSVATTNSQASNQKGAFYENQLTSGNWLMVKLVGVTVNRNAYGALVKLYADNRVLERELYSGGSYGSQSSQELHFGLSEISVIDSLVIHWGSGKASETIYGPPVNHRIRVKQGSGAFEISACNSDDCGEFILSNASEIPPPVIHPNPFSESFTISFNQSSGPEHFRLYDLNGSDLTRFITVEHGATSSHLITKDLPPGLYMLEITSSDGLKQTHKLVKK